MCVCACVRAREVGNFVLCVRTTSVHYSLYAVCTSAAGGEDRERRRLTKIRLRTFDEPTVTRRCESLFTSRGHFKSNLVDDLKFTNRRRVWEFILGRRPKLEKNKKIK